MVPSIRSYDYRLCTQYLILLKYRFESTCTYFASTDLDGALFSVFLNGFSAAVCLHLQGNITYFLQTTVNTSIWVLLQINLQTESWLYPLLSRNTSMIIHWWLLLKTCIRHSLKSYIRRADGMAQPEFSSSDPHGGRIEPTPSNGSLLSR